MTGYVLLSGGRLTVQSEFEINHAISYAHYVACLPQESPSLAPCLPRLRQILFGLLGQAKPRDSAGSSPASSSTESSTACTEIHAQLSEALLRAFLWVAWSDEGSVEEMGKTLSDVLETIDKQLKTSGSSSTFCLRCFMLIF